LIEVKPYQDAQGSKKDQIARMFDSIAHKYDFLNHFLSLGIDRYWRRKAISFLKKRNVRTLLDVASGTGDFAIAAAGMKEITVEAIDISQKMIEGGIEKIQKAGLDNRIHLHYGDSEDIQFADNTFDAVTAAFGVRNFENLNKGLSEMCRILKPGGIAVILEFSRPRLFPVKQIYNFYFRVLLPWAGRQISKDKSAYSYLPESVFKFPSGKDFIEELQRAGFTNCSNKILTFGIASIYTGNKRSPVSL
jgi:demethylmenaquinone methyltransferase / 2-methoxy-6-polyprenyl-1,4-benzoquinol methylase